MSAEDKPTKKQICDLLRVWINQRPGLDVREYGWGPDAYKGYREEYNSIARQGRDARALLRAVELSNIDAKTLLDAFDAYSGRLEITPAKNGEWRLSYTTGQYWPTEYRAAAAAVLARALWNYYRTDYPTDAANHLRQMFRRNFGRGLASRWFN